MVYKLLGMAVWKGGRWFLGRRKGKIATSRPVLFTGATAMAAAIFAAARRA
jgi:hypothetical protein